MMSSSLDTVPSPFLPGAGRQPPYLAGRVDEQAVLRQQLAWLHHDQGAPGDVVLVGPRGNGKTVLLGWLSREIEAGRALSVQEWTPDHIRTPAALTAELLPDSIWQRVTGSVESVSVAGHRVAFRKGDRPAAVTSAFRDALATRCRQRPLVVLLDEAHMLEVKTGRALLNLSQELRRQAPFLLVLAGTPNLPAHLNRMGVSFWSRAEQLGIGLLTEEASRDALLEPLSEHGVTVDSSVLAPVIAESQCYPFFLQLWGAALWRQLQANDASTLTPAHVAAARPEFDRRRVAYYETRFRELETRGLVAAAAAIAETFAGQAELSDPTLRTIVATALPEASDASGLQAALDALADLGYVWRSPTARDWTPGIPSLMDYLKDSLQAAGGVSLAASHLPDRP